MQLFKNALQNEVIWKHRYLENTVFPYSWVQTKMEISENDEVTVTDLAPDESAFRPPSPF